MAVSRQWWKSIIRNQHCNNLERENVTKLSSGKNGVCGAADLTLNFKRTFLAGMETSLFHHSAHGLPHHFLISFHSLLTMNITPGTENHNTGHYQGRSKNPPKKTLVMGASLHMNEGEEVKVFKPSLLKAFLVSIDTEVKPEIC